MRAIAEGFRSWERNQSWTQKVRGGRGLWVVCLSVWVNVAGRMLRGAWSTFRTRDQVSWPARKKPPQHHYFWDSLDALSTTMRLHLWSQLDRQMYAFPYFEGLSDVRSAAVASPARRLSGGVLKY
eukprot:gene16343-biopygen21786